MDKEYKEGSFRMGRCFVLVTKDNGKWHLSISTPNAQPSYKELKKARYQFIPNECYMAQIFPPKEEFINLHEYCLHLYEL